MKPEQVARVLNGHAAQLALLRLLIEAMARQAPDLPLLLRNFSAMAEDNEVRAMYSDMPESFFETFRQHRCAWEQLLSHALAAKAGEKRADS